MLSMKEMKIAKLEKKIMLVFNYNFCVFCFLCK